MYQVSIRITTLTRIRLIYYNLVYCFEVMIEEMISMAYAYRPKSALKYKFI